MRKAALKMIEFYMRRISPLFPARCRYYPTCSQYTHEAVERYGFIIGALLGVLRLLRCNPLWPGGLDPVPDFKRRDYLKKKKNHEDPGGSK